MSKEFGHIVPPHSVRFFDYDVACVDAAPGDWLLVDHGTGVSKGIEIGQSIIAATTQKDLRDFTWPDHSAFVTEDNGQILVSEMGPRGHELRPLSAYKAKRYAVVHFDVSDEARALALKFDRAMWDAEYGYLQYLALLINGTLAISIDLSCGNSVICSTHVTTVSAPMGFFPGRLAQSVMPAHLAKYTNARWPGK